MSGSSVAWLSAVAAVPDLSFTGVERSRQLIDVIIITQFVVLAAASLPIEGEILLALVAARK
jgi:hypothetical protein